MNALVARMLNHCLGHREVKGGRDDQIPMIFTMIKREGGTGFKGLLQQYKKNPLAFGNIIWIITQKSSSCEHLGHHLA